MSRAIFFDLDGTLTDSGPGIINCAQLALAHFGIQVPDRDQLRVFVGPPLRQSFARFGVPPASLDEAIARFRARYVPIGKFENTPYPGIAGLLDRLQGAGIPSFRGHLQAPGHRPRRCWSISSWPVTSSASAGPPWTQAGRPRRTSSPIFSPRSATPARW
ncbi:MAG: HAD hydrolase-like protein [Evtepia gabavorous]